MIICGKCKTKNSPRRIFCVNCGAKLDLENIIFNAPSPARLNALKALKFLAFFAVAAAIACAGLCLWPDKEQERLKPYALPAAPGGAEKIILSAAPLGHYQPLREKASRLDQAEHPATETFTEEEINAFMAYFSAELSPNLGNAAFINEIAGIAVSLNPDAAEVLVLANTRAISGLGPWRLTFRMRGAPMSSKNGFVFLVKGGALGRLPLPAGIIRWPARRLGRLFAASKPGQKAMVFLNRAWSFELGEEKIRANFGGK